MKSFYFAPNNGSFRLTKKNESIEKEVLGTTQSKELVGSFYFSPNNDSFRFAKKNSLIKEEISNATQVDPVRSREGSQRASASNGVEELADDVKGVNKSKRDFLKIAGIAGLGLAGTALFPKKADALILGGTPTSSVVGVKNASNTRINPATEETVASLATEATVSTLATEATVSTLLKPTDLTFDAGGSVEVKVTSSALPSSASTETTLQTISFGGKQYALKMTTVGSVDYVAEATVGTAFGTALWRAKKVDSTSGIVITWADGNENFDNSATDLTTLTYS